MGALATILHYSASSLFFGAVLALLGVGLVTLLVRGWYKDALFSPWTYAVGALLFILLSVQGTLLVGAAKLMEATDECQQIAAALIDQYKPQAEEALDSLGYAGTVPTDVVDEKAEALRSALGWYIFRRAMWGLGFIVVGAAIALRTLQRAPSQRQRPQRGGTAPGGGSDRTRRVAYRRRR